MRPSEFVIHTQPDNIICLTEVLKVVILTFEKVFSIGRLEVLSNRGDKQV